MDFERIVMQKASDFVYETDTRARNNMLSRIKQAIAWAALTNYWTDRLWNLRTSIAGALFFNGAIVGENENNAANYIMRRHKRYITSKFAPRYLKEKIENPVYMDNHIKKSSKGSWKGRLTGRQAAEVALQRAAAKAESGYEIVFTIAMPYATSRYLYHRTTAVIYTMLNMVGRGVTSKVNISSHYGTFDD